MSIMINFPLKKANLYSWAQNVPDKNVLVCGYLGLSKHVHAIIKLIVLKLISFFVRIHVYYKYSVNYMLVFCITLLSLSRSAHYPRSNVLKFKQDLRTSKKMS